MVRPWNFSSGSNSIFAEVITRVRYGAPQVSEEPRKFRGNLYRRTPPTRLLYCSGNVAISKLFWGMEDVQQARRTQKYTWYILGNPSTQYIIAIPILAEFYSTRRYGPRSWITGDKKESIRVSRWCTAWEQKKQPLLSNLTFISGLTLHRCPPPPEDYRTPNSSRQQFACSNKVKHPPLQQ